MLLRIAVVGTLIVAGSFLAEPAVSQTQRQSQTLGSRAPEAGGGGGGSARKAKKASRSAKTKRAKGPARKRD